jgi:DNA-binding transcriptional LysR family regulator
MRPGLENVMQGARRAAAIVDDLLSLARRGGQRRDTVALNQIITDFKLAPELAKLSERHPDVKLECTWIPSSSVSPGRRYI